MNHRNQWIAILFTALIILRPAATIVSDLQSGGAGYQYNEIVDHVPKQDLEKSWFMRLQDDFKRFTRRMMLRKELIKANENFTLAVTGGAYLGSTQVLLGKNNWLFFKTNEDGEPIKDYMGANHFTENELAEIAVNLTGTRDYFREKGIDFYVAAIPNKEIVYAENMPDTMIKVNEISRGEQLARYMKEETDLIYVYPKRALCNAKNAHQVYYMTDTHWNQKGAFVGMQEILKEAYGTYADLDLVDFIVEETDYAGDLAAVSGLADQYAIDTVYTFVQSSADRSQYRDETLLLVGDSFADFLEFVAQGYYKKVHRVAVTDFKMDMVEKYNPDVIIWEIGERKLEAFKNVNLLEK